MRILINDFEKYEKKKRIYCNDVDGVDGVTIEDVNSGREKKQRIYCRKKLLEL